MVKHGYDARFVTAPKWTVWIPDPTNEMPSQAAAGIALNELIDEARSHIYTDKRVKRMARRGKLIWDPRLEQKLAAYQEPLGVGLYPGTMAPQTPAAAKKQIRNLMLLRWVGNLLGTPVPTSPTDAIPPLVNIKSWQTPATGRSVLDEAGSISGAHAQSGMGSYYLLLAGLAPSPTQETIDDYFPIYALQATADWQLILEMLDTDQEASGLPSRVQAQVRRIERTNRGLRWRQPLPSLEPLP